MNQILNIEVEKKKKVLESTACCRACFKQRKQLVDEIVKELEQDLHHQLQKARQDWLREEIEFVKQVQAVEPKSNGRYNACNEILERYHSELTQDKK